jgi:hypothetical protein
MHSMVGLYTVIWFTMLQFLLSFLLPVSIFWLINFGKTANKTVNNEKTPQII